MRDTPDEQLMLAFAAGDASAFDLLYGRHKGPLFRYFSRQLGNRATCEEVFQETWLKVINARQQYAATAKFTTWLYTVAHNALVDYYRRTGRTPTDNPDNIHEHDSDDSLNDIIESEQIDASDQVALQQQCDHLTSLVERLPGVQREAFMLQHEAGLSLKEIAGVTGTGIETIKSRLRYAMNSLREGMRAYIEDGADHD